MGVRRFRSVSEMPGLKWRPRFDPKNLQIACALSQTARRLANVYSKPGVRKLRSVAERQFA
ncbi:MAG: hypothetical protein A2289_24455 [Deltaproteobacteria bacterium RIFOXYA12_FULL_58_15]|nr:MAG: hypothetical protein A2289_24455 [Deltaproteobacteria bacterium RIFOXYA12_FULL_58_15]OGR09003.1 MAG: hypothetical protein A2341_11705 [Deltaproteobacteria bacterium RIFOXYB12_FULL_58_9]